MPSNGDSREHHSNRRLASLTWLLSDEKPASAAPTGTQRMSKAPVATRLSSFVPEIQGLRTIALLLVVSFHIWFDRRVSGGVDIFLLISAYLMTRSLTARAETGSWTRPLTFTIRKLARLLPAAITVILLTMIAATVLLEPRYWATLFGQALAASSYTMNFWLQQAAVDYFAAQRSDATLYQHFWSLSVQGQIFLLWPLIHLAGEGIARLIRIPPRFVLLTLFSAIACWSFPYALNYVATDQQLAYFDTGARLWEFAAGSLLALVMPWLRIPLRLRRVMTAVGIAGALQCGVILPVQSSFPGWAALWPVVCALLVIAAADAPSPHRTLPPDPVLSNSVLRRIGGYSYALYLTHWPVLILSTILTGVQVPDPLGALGILLISAAIAVLIVHLVEQPLARWSRGERVPVQLLLPRFGGRTAAIVAVSAIAAVGGNMGGASWYQAMRTNAEQEVWSVDVSVRGPQVRAAGVPDALVPSQIVAQDQSGAPGWPCDPYDPWNSTMCSITGSEDPEREIVVIGSSHAVAYTSMIWETMQQHPDWGMRTYAAPGCFFHGLGATSDTACGEAWRQGIDYVLENEPDMLLVVGTISNSDVGDAMQNGREAPGFGFGLPDIMPLVNAVREQGKTELIIMRDVPRFSFNMYECALSNGFSSDECKAPVPPKPKGLDSFSATIEKRGAVWVDLVDTVCPEKMCRPSLGGIVTYLDESHITPVLSRSLAQAFASQVHPHVPWWPAQAWPQS